MILDRITLNNFRNYEFQELKFNGKFNFICGYNGQGKTNILEAVSFLTYGRSFLGSSESDCVKLGTEGFRAEAVFVNDLGNREILSVAYNHGQRGKTVSRNKERISSFSSEVFGRYPVVFLSPASLSITYGAPSERRKYFDILLSQASPLYLDRLKELSRILRQKNALLRGFVQHGRYGSSEFESMLGGLNEQLTTVSSDIVRRRLMFLKDYAVYFERSFLFLVPGGGSAEIIYHSDAFGNLDESDIAGESGFAEYYRNLSGEEQARGMTMGGPQRDDYLFSMKKAEESFLLRNYASQGEHKTYLVALKLAEYEFLKSAKSTSPVLLLDDILSELDHARVAQIVSHLRDYGQIFLTSADCTQLEKMERFYGRDEIGSFRIEQGAAVNEA